MWAGLPLSCSSPPLSYSIWVPAFAGMSGIRSEPTSARSRPGRAEPDAWRLTDDPCQGSSAPMNDNPDEREAAKRKLVGRAMVIGLVLLVAVYAVFTFLGRR